MLSTFLPDHEPPGHGATRGRERRASGSWHGRLPPSGAARRWGPTGVESRQLALEDLAGRVAGQLLDEHDVTGHLVASQIGPDMGPHPVGIERMTRADNYEDPQSLAE